MKLFYLFKVIEQMVDINYKNGGNDIAKIIPKKNAVIQNNTLNRKKPHAIANPNLTPFQNV